MKIVFAHNVYDRFLTLKNTIQIERKFFNDSMISVAYNGNFVDIFNDINNIEFIKFNETPHKIGCVNGCILSIQQLLEYDFDVLIFSHDDVHIFEDNFNIVENHIKSIINNEYDIICRKPLKYENNIEVFGGYYMMEIFYISKNAALQSFKNIKTLNNEKEIPVLGTPSPEVWLFNILNNIEFRKNIIKFEINSNDYNKQLIEQMGYYHKNIGLRGWKD